VVSPLDAMTLNLLVLTDKSPVTPKVPVTVSFPVTEIPPPKVVSPVPRNE
jgi:hypothetical protein